MSRAVSFFSPSALVFQEKMEHKVILIFSPFFLCLQGYHRPNHYIATQGKNKKLSKNCKTL